ncbi:MAG: type II secretion system F family protein [Candidatus Thermoplasmatota archaeon]|nr:type II secretion system F family protein [Candidatus Thermoplasmatota archaeon]
MQILWTLYELLNQSLLLVIVLPITLPCLAGAIPGFIERRRRRQLEEALPEVLESISSSIGAGLGLQQALTEISQNRQDETGKLLTQAIARSRSTSFDAALAEYAINSRSVLIQRVVNLLSVAVEQDAPLGEVTNSMSVEYDRLNKLINIREKEMGGQSFLLLMLMCLLLPGVMGFMFAVFGLAATGAFWGTIHSSMLPYLMASAALSVVVSGRMLGRTKQALWWIPFWSTISALLYMALFEAIQAGMA